MAHGLLLLFVYGAVNGLGLWYIFTGLNQVSMPPHLSGRAGRYGFWSEIQKAYHHSVMKTQSRGDDKMHFVTFPIEFSFKALAWMNKTASSTRAVILSVLFPGESNPRNSA